MKSRRTGFTLLEVMIAVAIMAIGLGAVFSAQAGSAKMAQRARKLSFATLLAQCKMGEIEEMIANKGLPANYMADNDKCCKEAPIEGFKCKWEVSPIVMPDSMFNPEEEKDKKNGNASSGSGLGGNPLASATGSGLSGLGSASSKGGLSGLLGAASSLLGGNKFGNSDPSSLTDPTSDPSADPSTDPTKTSTKIPKDPSKTKDANGKTKDKDLLAATDPSQLLAGKQKQGSEIDGLAAMAMQYVYPILKPAFESQIRRATITISWPEGDALRTFDVTQYIVAEQPVPLITDPNNPNALLGGTSTGTGTSGTSTLGGTGLGSPGLGTGLGTMR
jgi:general secretion pathway protein I